MGTRSHVAKAGWQSMIEVQKAHEALTSLMTAPPSHTLAGDSMDGLDSPRTRLGRGSSPSLPPQAAEQHAEVTQPNSSQESQGVTPAGLEELERRRSQDVVGKTLRHLGLEGLGEFRRIDQLQAKAPDTIDRTFAANVVAPRHGLRIHDPGGDENGSGDAESIEIEEEDRAVTLLVTHLIDQDPAFVDVHEEIAEAVAGDAAVRGDFDSLQDMRVMDQDEVGSRFEEIEDFLALTGMRNVQEHVAKVE